MNNMTSYNALYGTKTADNLMHAFEHEAASAMRSGVYSMQAIQDRDFATKRMLDEMNENGVSQGELWLGYLDETGTTGENLNTLSRMKREHDAAAYYDMADIADEEGFQEIAQKFRMAAAVNESHADILDERMRMLDGTMQYEANHQFRCPVCGYVVRGNTLPEMCPLCNNSY